MTREVVLRTAWLALTSWQPDDVDDLWAVHSDPEMMRHIRSGRPETRDETAALIEQYMTEYRDRGFTKWRLTDRDDRLVGRAGFGLDRRGRHLAYTIRRELWGRGLAIEIARALLAWHTEHAPAAPLLAVVATANPASRRVLAKVGFGEQGFEEHSGVPCEVLVHPTG